MFRGRGAGDRQPRTIIRMPAYARGLQEPINLLLLRLDEQEDRLKICEALLRAIAVEMGLNLEEILK